jgi:hypothetical protein
MTARAFIIAIENYGGATGMAARLPGTNDGAQSFYDWLIERKEVKPADIVACAEESISWRTTGTTRGEILAALAGLVEAGRDATGELFFFFAGHGFSYVDSGWQKPIDVLVASEFVSRAASGGACLKLQEVQEKLYQAMGPGNHFYFIEACRNEVSHAQINVLDTGLVFPPSPKKKPNRYTLYSTTPGEVSVVGSGFAEALVSGLKGDGRAKGWDGSRMYVTFDLLCEYVGRKMEGVEIEPDVQGPPLQGRIIELRPVPTSSCEVVVDNAAANDQFTLTVHSNFGRLGPFQFQGGSHSLDLKPFDYRLELEHPTTAVVQVSPPPGESLDLFSPCSVRFVKQTVPMPPGGTGMALPQDGPVLGRRGSATLGGRATLTLRGEITTESEISVKNLKTGNVRRGTGPLLSGSFAPGTYQVSVREGGATVSRRKLVVRPGERVDLDLLERPPSRVRERILQTFTGDPLARVANFSEQLGPMVNWDLGLWLSLFGAARIVGGPGSRDLSKIRSLPLASFDDAAKDDAFVYVLAGFDKSAGSFAAGLGTGPEVGWEPLDAVEGLDGLYHRRFRSRPGPQLFSAQIPGHVPLTYATYCLPNRATLLILTQDAKGQLTFHQFLLPIRRLFRHLPEKVRRRLEHNPLRVVRLMSQAQTRFARNRPLLPEEATAEEVGAWVDLITNKWLDPVMSLIAAYDIIRQGGLEKPLETLSEMILNLHRYFVGIPDIVALEHLLGFRDALPQAPPMLLEGVLAFGEQQPSVLPLDPSKLDYASPWTKWVGAVDGPAPSGPTKPPVKPNDAGAWRDSPDENEQASARRKSAQKGKRGALLGGASKGSRKGPLLTARGEGESRTPTTLKKNILKKKPS